MITSYRNKSYGRLCTETIRWKSKKEKKKKIVLVVCAPLANRWRASPDEICDTCFRVSKVWLENCKIRLSITTTWLIFSEV